MSKELQWEIVGLVSKEKVKELYDKSMANKKEEDKMKPSDFMEFVRSCLESELKSKFIEMETNLNLYGHTN